MTWFESQECYPKAHPTSKSFRFVVFRPFSVFFRPPKSNYLFKPLPHMSRPLKKKAIPMIWFESQECYPKAHLTSKSFRFVVFRPFSVIFRPPKSNCLFKPLPHMSRLLKKKAIPMICFEPQECYPKAHLTSKSFRFVVFRPFSVFFRPPKTNCLFQPLPHMSRLLKKKAIPMICFEPQECYPKAHLTSKSFRFVVFRPFSVFFRPPKTNCLFQPLPHMSRLLKKKAIPMIWFESQECYPKAHLTSKSSRFVVFRPFSVIFRPPKSNCLFKPLPHMSRPLKKKAIPMIRFESQECYPKAHPTSKSFRFLVFKAFSVLFRPPKKQLPVSPHVPFISPSTFPFVFLSCPLMLLLAFCFVSCSFETVTLFLKRVHFIFLSFPFVFLSFPFHFLLCSFHFNFNFPIFSFCFPSISFQSNPHIPLWSSWIDYFSLPAMKIVTCMVLRLSFFGGGPIVLRCFVSIAKAFRPLLTKVVVAYFDGTS